MRVALSHLTYFSVIALLICTVPVGFMGDARNFGNAVVIIGFLGLWRYSWATLNFTRALVFRRIVYPRRRKARHAAFRASGVKSHMYVMITTYLVDSDVTLMVYRKLFRAAARAPDGATIVASVVDGKDERLIRSLFSAMDPGPDVSLVIDRIAAAGKRDAMGKALRILATMAPTEHDILVFIDGDTAPPEDLWEHAAPVFSDPRVGALTTDEAALIDKPGLYHDWFDLRFAQRQVMMCSMGLSDRVLTLTGRLSVFRASLATDPGFIEGIEHDYIDHWRLGRVDFLTGDDKSTWFWLLRNGYHTSYLPDVKTHSVETQPRDTFYDSAKTLMVRWFGNMIRTNGRALRQSPRDIGAFTWWSILDQRVSMWTTMVGPISVAITSYTHSPAVILVYIAWVMATRYMFCVYIALFNGTWFPVTHPPILYFGQVVGSALKIFVLFRLDRQKWTRQTAGAGGSDLSWYDRMKQHESTAHHILALAWLVLAIAFINTIE